MGSFKKSIDSFRPKGRLVTTLREHKRPVTSVAVTDDQTMFMTASRDDGEVHVWSAADIERDVTARSRFSIQC